MANLEFECSECDVRLPVNTTGSPFAALAAGFDQGEPVTKTCECGAEAALVDPAE